MKSDWWGSRPAFMGWTYLSYEFIYLPIVNWLGVEPWSLTRLGVISVCVGIGVNVAQLALGLRPQQS